MCIPKIPIFQMVEYTDVLLLLRYQIIFFEYIFNETPILQNKVHEANVSDWSKLFQSFIFQGRISLAHHLNAHLSQSMSY